MSDDGNMVVVDYGAHEDGHGGWDINPFRRLSGVGISADRDDKRELELSDWAWKQARRVYEKEGRIKPGEPFFRVIGTVHASPPDPEQDKHDENAGVP